MNSDLNLIVMLTHNDKTVENAYEVFEQCKECNVQYWGIKEKGLPIDKMKELCSYIKNCGKTAVMEVVAYSEPESLEGAKIAADCNCDILMGTRYYDSVNEFCKKQNLKYMPFIGDVQGRPSVLNGSIEEMLNEADVCIEKGVYGFDLLGYRYQGDTENLIREFVKKVNSPVCVAGSISSYDRLDVVKESNAWAFTIGGAFFENKFDGSFEEQIKKVCQYIEN